MAPAVRMLVVAAFTHPLFLVVTASLQTLLVVLKVDGSLEQRRWSVVFLPVHLFVLAAGGGRAAGLRLAGAGAGIDRGDKILAAGVGLLLLLTALYALLLGLRLDGDISASFSSLAVLPMLVLLALAAAAGHALWSKITV